MFWRTVSKGKIKVLSEQDTDVIPKKVFVTAASHSTSEFKLNGGVLPRDWRPFFFFFFLILDGGSWHQRAILVPSNPLLFPPPCLFHSITSLSSLGWLASRELAPPICPCRRIPAGHQSENQAEILTSYHCLLMTGHIIGVIHVIVSFHCSFHFMHIISFLN